MRIVTGVRDPVARNISAFFQNLSSFGFDPHGIDTQDIDTLIASYFRDFNHAEPLDWFDRELKYCTGVDVFNHDLTGDYSIIDSSRSAIILKTEAEDSKKEVGIQAFTGQNIHLTRKNVAEQKLYSSAYEAFLKKIEFPKEYLDKMYFSKYCKHFYSPEELRNFRAKWEK